MISIIIPVHNGECTLEACLNSILDQSYVDYELIVVDNHSTDHTHEIICDLMKKDHRVKYVYEAAQSRGAARNAGIRVAKFEIIVMTDADCVVPQDWLTQLTKPILSQSEDIVVGNEEDILDHYWTRLQQKANQGFLRQHINGQYIDHLDTKNVAIQKKCFNTIGLFNERLVNFEDFEFKIRLKQAGYRLFFLKNLKVKHRHSESLLKLFQKRIDQGFWATKIYLLHKKFLRNNPEAMTSSMSVVNFITFLPWLFVSSFRIGFSQTIYELLTGVAWRIGIVRAIL